MPAFTNDAKIKDPDVILHLTLSCYFDIHAIAFQDRSYDTIGTSLFKTGQVVSIL